MKARWPLGCYFKLSIVCIYLCGSFLKTRKVAPENYQDNYKRKKDPCKGVFLNRLVTR